MADTVDDQPVWTNVRIDDLTTEDVALALRTPNTLQTRPQYTSPGCVAC
jgi:hypothetical protein